MGAPKMLRLIRGDAEVFANQRGINQLFDKRSWCNWPATWKKRRHERSGADAGPSTKLHTGAKCYRIGLGLWTQEGFLTKNTKEKTM